MTIIIDDTNAHDLFIDLIKERKNLLDDVKEVELRMWEIVKFAYRNKYIDKRQYEVMKLRWGFGYYGSKHTQTDIAKIQKCTTERIRQIETKAIESLYKIPGSEIYDLII